MPLNPRVLRRLFAGGAIVAILLVAGYYIHNLLKVQRKIANTISNISSNVTKSAKGFTYSQSEGGKTLYTIHAASAEEFKEGGRAALHDVSIVIYGREGNRTDQIYGADFQYDPATGDIVSQGEVRIDMESESNGIAGRDHSVAREMKNLIHVKTSGLTFNRQSGLAITQQKIEFRIPEANGSALGATYDSRKSELKLKSAVNVVTSGKQKATITGAGATITKDPRKIVLQAAKLDQSGKHSVMADNLTILLRDDDTVDRIVGVGNVQASQPGPKGFNMTAPQGEVMMGARNQTRSATFSGGVTMERRGDSPAMGKAGRVLLDFGPDNRVVKVHAEDAVEIMQGSANKSVQQLQAAGLDLFIHNGKTMERAVTSGPAQVQVTQSQPNQQPTRTVITAGQFEGKFDAKNHLKSVFGSPNAKVVSLTPGKAERVSTSRDVSATFNDQGAISTVEQTGNFHYQEGQQTASSDRARYTLTDESIVLTGAPRLTDAGVSVTADTVQINRKTGNATAQNNVKATYTEMKPQPDGAFLASGDPIHVTGTSMTANRVGEMATFTNARLWQGANIVEGPTISFDRAHRSLQSQGSQSSPVRSVFVQPDPKTGKTTPVRVTADKLTYVDADRKAVFTRNVLVHWTDSTMTADTIQVLLHPGGNQGQDTASRLDHIIAQGDILIDQKDRKATGKQVVYTAQDQKFVLTGSEDKRPSIFDAEHGEISGDSLTFFSADDRVLIDSREGSKTLIHTRIRDASKK
jgi:lipopolysaccharide export system protein LptA